jgi:hypothetical protein
VEDTRVSFFVGGVEVGVVLGLKEEVDKGNEVLRWVRRVRRMRRVEG